MRTDILGDSVLFIPKKATWYNVNDVFVNVFESLAANVRLPVRISVAFFRFAAAICMDFTPGGHRVFSTAVKAKHMSTFLSFGTSNEETLMNKLNNCI